MSLLSFLSESGGEVPNAALAWILYGGLGFLFLMIVIGWLVSLRKPGQPGVDTEPGSAIQQEAKRREG